MAGTGVKILAGLIAVPLSKFVGSKLEGAWRSTTGTEPPSNKNRKEQEKANKEAAKLGLLPRPIEQPKLADALMWSALTAMSIIAVKWVAERSAEEVHRFVTGSNPPTGRSLSAATDIGAKQGSKLKKAV